MEFLKSPAVKAFSRYIPTAVTPKADLNSMVLYRAMSAVESAKLREAGQFTMRIGKDLKETGLKFFATDINYSTGLANKKNVEAIEKFDPEVPYKEMVGAVVDKPDVAFGLEEDIGVHGDSGHTQKFLSSGQETNESERAFQDISRAEGFPEDESGRGYVLKHESGGLNCGVKAKTNENTMPHWDSPIEYFNRLVRWRAFIGHFETGQETK